MALSPDHNSHDWTPVSITPTAEIHTCERCGLLSLKTTSNVFYFAQLADPFLGCRSIKTPRPYAPRRRKE